MRASASIQYCLFNLSVVMIGQSQQDNGGAKNIHGICNCLISIL
jgi:hypothetical protein